MPKRNRVNKKIKDLGDCDLPPEVDAKVTKMIAEADEEVRVNFRWN